MTEKELLEKIANFKKGLPSRPIVHPCPTAPHVGTGGHGTAATRGSRRTISAIARDISRNWPKPYFGAVPYLQAMYSLNSINDTYGADSAREIVEYFLSNASGFRGGNASSLKSELKTLLGRR